MFYEIVIEWIKTRGCEVQRDETGEFDESKASSRCAGSIVMMYLYDYAG